MFRIWAKVLKDGHIVGQITYEKEERFTYSAFFTYLQDICDALDVPTPVLLNPHPFPYEQLTNAIFRKSDFMEEVPFDRLVLENIL